MADIKNKNELKRRTELFIDEFSHEEYMINESFCKETMRMMREFIGHTSHLLDCAYAKIEKAKKKARAKAIDDFAERLNSKISDFVLEHKDNLDFASGISVVWNIVDEIAEEMRCAE